jgi:hypothetical protein
MTSIEWLIMQLPVSIRVELYEKNTHIQAKEMHKAEIIDAHIQGHNAPSSTIKNFDAKQYYNETYGDLK